MADTYLHTVARGEHIRWIADHFHVSDWNTIWDLNRELRGIRHNPNILMVGDQLAVPIAECGEESGQTELVHPFETMCDPLFLRLRILGEDYSPLARVPYALVVDEEGPPMEGETDEHGQIEREIPPTANFAALTVRIPAAPRNEAGGRLEGEVPVTFNLWIGALHPILEPAPDLDCYPGVQQRLDNLGLDCGPVIDEPNQPTRAAIRTFRVLFGLPEGETSDEEFQRKLAEIHDRPDSVPAPIACPSGEGT